MPDAIKLKFLYTLDTGKNGSIKKNNTIKLF